MKYDNVQEVKVGLSNAKFRKDLQDSVEMLAYIQRQVVYDAKITKATTPGEYEVSIYGNGYSVESTLDAVKAFKLYNGDQYELNQPVQVNLLPDDTALIIRTNIPPGTGIYKVLQILTEGNPGSVGWDYWRFPPTGSFGT